METLRSTPVYSKSTADAHVALFLQAGEAIELLERRGNFRRVRLSSHGHWYQGYISQADADAMVAEHSAKRFALGVGLGDVQLVQGARHFETEDEVNYTTTSYKSSSVAPFLALQWKERRFWRVELAYKPAHYKGSAHTDTTPGTQPIELNQNFLSLTLQRAFQPLDWQPLYVGIGAEVAKATSVSLKLNGLAVATSSSEEPTYLGGQIFAGLQFSLAQHWSIVGEGSFELIPNQSPMVDQYELAVCLLYWL